MSRPELSWQVARKDAHMQVTPASLLFWIMRPATILSQQDLGCTAAIGNSLSLLLRRAEHSDSQDARLGIRCHSHPSDSYERFFYD